MICAPSSCLKFLFDWINTQKNHLLSAGFELTNPIREVFSEDMNQLIKRNFEPDYDMRKNLPKTRGIEAKTNTAPMQRGLLIDEEGNIAERIASSLPNPTDIFKITVKIELSDDEES